MYPSSFPTGASVLLLGGREKHHQALITALGDSGPELDFANNAARAAALASATVFDAATCDVASRPLCQRPT